MSYMYRYKKVPIHITYILYIATAVYETETSMRL